MELLLNYLLKFSLCLLVLYLFYYAVLRTQTNFKFNRLYLLLATPVALLLPLLKWPASLATKTNLAEGLRAVQLPEISISAVDNEVSQTDAILSFITFEQMLLGIYLIGAVLLVVNLIRQLVGIRKLAATATASTLKEKGVTIFETPDHSATFAFLNFVFISRQGHLSATERKQVLAHELAHVKLKHTLDILCFEILTALLWFNPIVWLLKNEIRDVHEYQADAHVLNRHQITQYSSLLSKEVLHKAGISVGSYFKEPQIIKRLKMLNKHDIQSSWIRPALLLPLLGGLAFIFSSQQLNAGITSDIGSTVISEPQNSVLPEVLESDTKIETANTVRPDAPAFSDVQQKTSPSLEESQVSSEQALKVQELDAPIVETVLEEKPYTYVEQMPTFKGGELELQKFIAQNIRYPRSAIQQEKEGVVFISFEISKDGIPTKYDMVKGISDDLDAEALRVIKLTEPNWTAGRQNGRVVPVKFTMPIRFNL